MVLKLTRPSRRSIRLADYDYRCPGAYFVTMCTWHRRRLFGRIINGRMLPNALGVIAGKCWTQTSLHFPCVQIDEFAVMPDHFHGIVIIHPRAHWNSSPSTHPGGEGNAHRSCDFDRTDDAIGKGQARVALLEASLRPRGAAPGSLGAIIGSYKSAATREINRIRGTPGARVWARNYYESIIRDEEALSRVRRYIRENPKRSYGRGIPAPHSPKPFPQAL